MAPRIRSTLVAGLVGLALGAGGLYLVLRAATARWEDRATRAEGTIATLRALAATETARADSAAAAAAAARAGPPAPDPEIRIRTIRETVTDTAATRAALEALARELHQQLADSGAALAAQDVEVRALRAALALEGEAADTAGAVLGDRPGVAVTWSWRPRVTGEVFARYELPGQVCAGAGPMLTVWRFRVQGYAGLCGTPTLAQAAIEPRAGVTVALRVF